MPGGALRPADRRATLMKISCLLTSYNRPTWVRHALKSVADQTHKDYQLIVLDNSTVFDIRKAVGEFSFTEVEVHHRDVPPQERRSKNQLAVNLNIGLLRATGDLVCFLCDDDYYYPSWFAEASKYFDANKDVAVAFGKLVYSECRDMTYEPKPGNVRFFDAPVRSPSCALDHNQVIHRRFPEPFLIPEDPKAIAASDANYFNTLARYHVFHPIATSAVVKRHHPKGLYCTWPDIYSGKADQVRE